MSKTVLNNTLRYFDALLEELREQWRQGTLPQRTAIENKAAFVKALREDVIIRITCLKVQGS